MIDIQGFQAISCYIKGFLKKKESAPEVEKPKPKKIKKVYSIRDVVKYHYRSRVEKENPLKPSDKDFLGGYQKAVTAVMEGMSKDELEEANEIAELWNKEGCPSELQLK